MANQTYQYSGVTEYATELATQEFDLSDGSPVYFTCQYDPTQIPQTGEYALETDEGNNGMIVCTIGFWTTVRQRHKRLGRLAAHPVQRRQLRGHQLRRDVPADGHERRPLLLLRGRRYVEHQRPLARPPRDSLRHDKHDPDARVLKP